MEETPQRTLFVRNIPFSLTNEALETCFCDYGPIHGCFVIKDKGKDQNKGYGYVEFSALDDAVSAKKQVTKIDGRKVGVHFASRKPRSKKKKKPQQKTENKLEEDDSEEDEAEEESGKKSSVAAAEVKSRLSEAAVVSESEDLYQAKHVVVVKNFDPSSFESDIKPVLTKLKNLRKLNYPVVGRDNSTAFIIFKSKKDAFKAAKRLSTFKIKDRKIKALLLHEDRGEARESLINAKRCRLILRNLSFKITAEILREKFCKYGEITEVKIPTKPDGKMFGFGFLQFRRRADAQKALEQMNAKTILNRPVAVDWAVSKHEFEKVSKMEEADSGSYSSSGDEARDNEDVQSSGEEESEDESEGSVTSAEETDQESEGSESDEGEDDSDVSGDESDVSDSDDDEGFSEEETEGKKKSKNLGKSDVDQGKTLFIRNLSYDTEEESLCEFFEQYGSLKYGRVVVDPDTEHSRGTAFVQFEDKADAEKVLAGASDLNKPMILDGRKLSVVLALPREKAVKIQAEKKKKPEKDNRNLYLAREGLIRGGTQAAVGLSQADLTKRSKLETAKRGKLKDPNYFISDTRLSVHNIPATLDDKKFRQIFLKAAGDYAARITECRIMRDRARTSNKGVSKSLGYGFINFSDHKHAMRALRDTNNNPELFGEKKRLIVEFSMENRAALVARDKRLERAKAKQETFAKGKTTFAEVRTKKKSRDNRKAPHNMRETASASGNDEEESETKKGPKGLPSHWGPKQRHRDRGKKAAKPGKTTDKKHQKLPTQKRKAEVDTAVKKPKKVRKQEVRDHVDNLVDKYKKQFTAAYNRGKSLSATGRSKWFAS